MPRLRSWEALGALALLLMATACAGTPPPEPARNEAPRFLSLAPESLGRSLSLSQLVIGEYGDRIYKMRIEVDITPARLAVVGLSPFSAHCQSKLVACKSGEKQVFEDADMRQGCGWQHCRPLPLGLFISVYHTRPLTSWRTKDAINACRDQRIPEFKEHMLLNLHHSPSTVQTTDLVATNE